MRISPNLRRAKAPAERVLYSVPSVSSVARLRRHVPTKEGYSTSRPQARIWLDSVRLRRAIRRQNHFQSCFSKGAMFR